MKKCQIFVACHKPCDVPNDNVYVPIHVGRSLSSYKLDMIGDDTGDNISNKNSTYCEITALYWIWKNIRKSDVEYVGLCHYRRFFDFDFQKGDIDALFSNNTDVIIPAPHIRVNTLQHGLLLYISSDDFVILKSVLKKKYPEYLKTMDKILLGVKDYPYNMLICKKELFDNYCDWLFSILTECEKLIKLSPYSRGKRVFGYMAEFLMPIYFIHNGYKYKTLETVFIGENGPIVHRTNWKIKLVGAVVSAMFKMKKEAYMYDRAHLDALKNDSIEIDL